MKPPKSMREITNVRSFIEKEILKPAPRDAHWVFDCDGTLITGDIASHVAWAMLREGISHPEQTPEHLQSFKEPNGHFAYPQYRQLRNRMAEEFGHNGLYNWECFVQAGLSPLELKAVAVRILEEALIDKTIAFTTPIAELAKEISHQAWIVSGSPKMNVAAVAQKLGIHTDRTLGTLLKTVNDVYIPQFAQPGLVWEKTKQDVLAANGVHAPWFVAGDTIGDWFMLEIAVGWSWCIVWDDYRFRGREFREILHDRVLKDSFTIPERPGCWVYEDPAYAQKWVIEVKHHH